MIAGPCRGKNIAIKRESASDLTQCMHRNAPASGDPIESPPFHTSDMTLAVFLLALTANASCTRKLAPVSIDSLVRKTEVILRVSPTKNPHRPTVRELVWSSIGQFTGTLDLDSTPAGHPKGTPNEGGSNGVYEDSIVFLHRAATHLQAAVKMTGAYVSITLYLNRGECAERSPESDLPSALVVNNAVYFPLPFKRKYIGYVDYPELKSAVLAAVRRN